MHRISVSAIRACGARFCCGKLPRTGVELDTKHEGMTASDHAERARSQDQTVAEYCRQTGLSVHALYSARRELKKKDCCRIRAG